DFNLLGGRRLMNGQQIVKDAEAPESMTQPKEFLKTGPVPLVGLGVMGLGSTVLALYYGEIGYLPDIDWHSLLIYLAAASIIGAGLGGLYFLSLFLPGFLWAEFLVSDSK